MLSVDAFSGDLNRSETFGLEQGMACYRAMIERCPSLQDDVTIDYLARRATRIAMIVEGAFDVDVDMASGAIVNAFESEFALSD